MLPQRDRRKGDGAVCRHCGTEAAWSDGEGPVHVCCRMNEVLRPGMECVCAWGAVVVAPSFGPCRLCGTISYFTDDLGWVHYCCRLNLIERPGLPCLSCAAARVAEARYMRGR